MCAIVDEVIRPDVICMLWALSNAGPLIQPQTSTFRLLLWNLEPFLPPYGVDCILPNSPALLLEACACTIAVPTIFLRELDDTGPQAFFSVIFRAASSRVLPLDLSISKVRKCWIISSGLYFFRAIKRS